MTKKGILNNSDSNKNVIRIYGSTKILLLGFHYWARMKEGEACTSSTIFPEWVGAWM